MNPITAPGSNRLTVLAADIRAAHQDVTRGAQAVAERALAAGQMLAEAKDALPHGAWEPWLAEHVGMSARTARRYMQLARSGMKTATVADLGIKGAAEAITRRKEESATDYRDDYNNSHGWPMPSLGGHVLITSKRGSFALIWPNSEHDEIRYYDFIALPGGPDTPATYSARGSVAWALAGALEDERFALADCECTVFDTPLDDDGFPRMLREWRKADRKYEYARAREENAERIANLAKRFGISPKLVDRCLRLATIPEATFEAIIVEIKAAGEEITAETIFSRAAGVK